MINFNTLAPRLSATGKLMKKQPLNWKSCLKKIATASAGIVVIIGEK